MKQIRVSVAGAVQTLTLDRPDRANAYGTALLDGLEEAIRAWEAAPPAVIVVESAGEGAFCAGADQQEMAEAQRTDPLKALELRSQRLFTRLARLPSVSVAAVQGAAVAGGMELALACDLRVGGPGARFWLPETSMGILPAAGGTTRLARLIGVSRAKAVILGGLRVGAAEALAWGLLHRLEAEPRAAAQGWAQEIARRDPFAQRLAKELLDARESDNSLAVERAAEAILYSRRGG